jgi:hypothetical protein
MKNIQNYEEFINESVNNFKLSEDEVRYLWSKIELLKKRKASDTKNDLYQLLNSDKTTFSNEEFIKILNSLEYSFKKKLKDGTITTEFGKSIHNKLPDDWLGIKYSNIDSKKKRDDKSKEKDTE